MGLVAVGNVPLCDPSSARFSHNLPVSDCPTMPNDGPISNALGGFQRALAELETENSCADIRWRCQAGLLALGYNVAASAEPSACLSNAAKVLSLVLRADLHGFAEIADDDAPLTLTIHDPARQGRGEDSAIKFGNVGRGASTVFYACRGATREHLELGRRETFQRSIAPGARCGVRLGHPAPMCRQVLRGAGRRLALVAGFCSRGNGVRRNGRGPAVSSVACACLEADLHRHHALAGAVLDMVKSLVLMLDTQGNIVTIIAPAARRPGLRRPISEAGPCGACSSRRRRPRRSKRQSSPSITGRVPWRPN